MLRRVFLSLVLFGSVLAAAERAPLVTAVDSIGLTVSDLDRSVEFYSKVLSFEKVSELEVDGPEYERLEGVFGLRMRTARLHLGELILAQLSPAGYVELSRANIVGPTWDHPAYAGGCVYARSDSELVCVELPAADDR